MAFPSRTLRAVCEISSGTLKISQRPPAYTHEAGALDVIVDLKNGGNAYVPDASVVAGMYLFWQDTQYMSEFVEMGISGCTLSGTFSDALTAMPGCPLLVVQLQDTDTGDIIVAAAAPIQITKVEGNLIVTTRPPSPSEIVYIGRSPYINTENYHWMQWNSVALAYEDTGVVAKGMPATFTATAQGLPAGSTPTATITGTAENPVINLGIPKGDTGETGATGPAAGFGTISATVDNTSGTPGVTVNTSGPDTAKNMTFAFTGLKGAQGDPGPVSQVCGVSPNAQGNVPLKGTDIPLQTMSLVTVKQAIDNVGSTFTGATSSTAGTKGQVPAPAAGDDDSVLGGSGNWVTGSGIATSDNDATPISTSLSSLNDQIANEVTARTNADTTLTNAVNTIRTSDSGFCTKYTGSDTNPVTVNSGQYATYLFIGFTQGRGSDILAIKKNLSNVTIVDIPALATFSSTALTITADNDHLYFAYAFSGTSSFTLYKAY